MAVLSFGGGSRAADDTSTHWVYDHWLEDTFKTRFLEFDPRGNLRSVGLYHDPLLERTHRQPRAGGLAPAFYVLPQNREMAEFLYRSAVSSVGWNRWWMPVLGPTSQPRLFTIGLLLAREFGDHTTERRLTRKLARFENGRYFDAGDAAAGQYEEEFGYFFNFDEAYPRGQETALLMVRDLLDGEGEWHRAFNESDAEKFAAPTVEGVDYPRMGLATAWNDPGSASLELETYVATRSNRGSPTRFRVTRLPDSGAVSVMRDGAEHGDWKALGSDTIEIGTEIGDHTFRIHTGYRLDASVAFREHTPSRRANAPSTAMNLRPIDLTTAGAAFASGGGCPCCVGP